MKDEDQMCDYCRANILVDSLKMIFDESGFQSEMETISDCVIKTIAEFVIGCPLLEELPSRSGEVTSDLEKMKLELEDYE
jgi:hypothetical protein